MERLDFVKIILIGCLLLISSCSTPQFRIQSNPSDATVEAVYPSGERRNLGKTPVRVSSDEVNPRKEAILIQISNPTHREARVLVPNSLFSQDIEFTVQLEPLSRGDKEIAERQMNQVAQMVAEIQRDIQARSFDVAQTKATKAISEFPSVGMLYVLQGNIQFLRGQLAEALVSYRRAQNLIGNTPEVVEVIERIERSQGSAR